MKLYLFWFIEYITKIKVRKKDKFIAKWLNENLKTILLCQKKQAKK